MNPQTFAVDFQPHPDTHEIAAKVLAQLAKEVAANPHAIVDMQMQEVEGVRADGSRLVRYTFCIAVRA